MHNHQHPDPVQLDQLRAGLLDDQAQAKQSLEDHLAHCAQCQSLYDSWEQLGPVAMGPQLDSDSLRSSLQQVRARAFSEADTHSNRNFAPYATAALLLVAVTVGFWMTQTEQQDTQLATIETSADVPELYEDIDFYLWLAEQNGTDVDTEDANPNNT